MKFLALQEMIDKKQDLKQARKDKKATEAYWGGKLSQADLLAEAKRLRLAHWTIQKDAGVDIIPSNDFALYDQVLHQIQDFGVSFLF